MMGVTGLELGHFLFSLLLSLGAQAETSSICRLTEPPFSGKPRTASRGAKFNSYMTVSELLSVI